MKNYRFYKNESGWFVDLPEWPGDVWELEMVAGADTFCDIIAQGEDEIHVTLASYPFPDCEVLQFTHLGRLEGWELGEGSWYFLHQYMGMDYALPMWLCDVTKFVFGDFPNKIYFR